LILVLLAACTGHGRPYERPARAVSVEIEVGAFYTALAGYGTWIELTPLGRVWIPGNVPAGWRPYSRGHWAYTEVGWTWVSNWEWGWAPFHYGRWALDPEHGWVWVPGTVWAPAWVAWRYGDGWVGWAPLPPAATWSFTAGLATAGVHFDVLIRPSWWLFVEDRWFVTPQLHRHIVAASRGEQLAALTRDATRYEARQRSVVNLGIAVDRIESQTGHAVPRYTLREVNEPPTSANNAVRRDTVRVYRPQPGDTARSPATGKTTQTKKKRPARSTRPPA
jgi:hypothetical protein